MGWEDADGSRHTLTVKVERTETGRPIQGSEVSMGTTGNITVNLPDGQDMDAGNRVSITVTDNENTPQADRTVIVKADLGNTAQGQTNKDGQLTVPSVESAYTDENGEAVVGHAGTAGDNAGALLYDVLRHIEDGHGDVKGMCDQIDRHECFENPLEDIKGVKVVEVVLFDNHADQLIAQDKGDDDARNGHHHRLAQALYHGEDPGVPCRRGLSHTRRHVPDLLVDLVKQPVEIAHNAIPQDSLDPIQYGVEDIQHRLHPALTEQIRQQGDELHPNQRDAAAGHELLHALAFY